MVVEVVSATAASARAHRQQSKNRQAEQGVDVVSACLGVACLSFALALCCLLLLLCLLARLRCLTTHTHSEHIEHIEHTSHEYIYAHAFPLLRSASAPCPRWRAQGSVVGARPASAVPTPPYPSLLCCPLWGTARARGAFPAQRRGKRAEAPCMRCPRHISRTVLGTHAAGRTA